MSESTRVILLIFSVPFGLVLGSFLNVCIFRLPRNCMSIVKPRSRCPGCLTQIEWCDNIPILSFILLGGKCRNCGMAISPRYLIVELITALLIFYVASVYLHSIKDSITFEGIVHLAIKVYLIACMIICTFIDFEFRILPDEITVSGIVAGLLCGLIFPFIHDENLPTQVIKALRSLPLAGLVASLTGAVLGSGITYCVGVFGAVLFKKEAMGLGDVKYMAMLGAFLGFKFIMFAFILAALFGCVFGIAWYIATKDRYIAFGPFLSMGALVMLLFGQQIEDFVASYQGFAR